MADKDLTNLPPYTTVDFKDLAKQDPDFKSIWQKAKGHLDFKDASTTIALAKAILKRDFDLVLDVPDDRLCPPIPNRFNYVSWIQALLDTTSPTYTNTYDPIRPITGLDIGTGASAIYTMLCLRTRPNWTMCATDIDAQSFSAAIRNLALNNLATRTKPLQTIPSNPLIPFDHLAVPVLDFTICNPPFFTSADEMHASIRGDAKAAPPSATCTGAEVEMVCPGGDVGFVTRLVEESLVLRDKVHWYTSLLGKLTSAKAIITLLKQHGVENWAVGVVEVGNATRRWIVGWSFGDLRPRQDVARMERIANEFLPFPTEYRFAMSEGFDGASATKHVDDAMKALDLRTWTWDTEAGSGVGEAAQNVWNRAYRYKRKKELEAQGLVNGGRSGGGQEVKMEDGKEGGQVALAFRISVKEASREIVVEWLRGRDQVLWESFCGMLHRGFKT